MTTTADRRGPAGAVRRPLAVALVGGLVSALAACSAATPQVPPSPSTSTVVVGPTIAPTKQAVPTPAAQATWPLTGVAGDVVDRPALAVKIENTADARPQEGLNQADVVWETIVEFEVSRFVAVFQSQVPGEIGPVRSVRPMDMPITAPLKGLFAYSGGQAGILTLAQNSGEQNFSFDSGNAAFYRTKDRPSPHNVYTKPADLWSQAEAGRTAPAPQFAFARTAPQASAVAAGTPAGLLSYKLSSYAHPSWAWDAGSGVWKRSEGTAAATTVTSGQGESQITAVNVVTVVADHPNTQFRAQNNAPVPTYTLVGSGDGLLATGGKTIPVSWSKAAQDAPLVLTLADGSPATLAPGNTWVELVPKGSGSYTVG